MDVFVPVDATLIGARRASTCARARPSIARLAPTTEAGHERDARHAGGPGPAGRHYRRGIYLLPSLFTVGNMFCGYACIVYAMRGELGIAAPFIGIAFVLDMLDGRIARHDEHDERVRPRARLARRRHLVRHGAGGAGVRVGPVGLGRVGWAAASSTSRRRRCGSRASTSSRPRRSTSATSSACRRRAAAGVVAATVYAWPYPLDRVSRRRSPPVAVVLVPAALMVSTIRFRSFKTINFGWTPSYMPLFLVRRADRAHRHEAERHAGGARVRLSALGVRRAGGHAAAGAPGRAASRQP